MSQNSHYVRPKTLAQPSEPDLIHQPENVPAGEQPSPSTEEMVKHDTVLEVTGREKLKRHRIEMAGRVLIPETWNQEEFLKNWSDCSAFDASLVHARILSARAALVEERRRVGQEGVRFKDKKQVS